jgi:tetratricopeptide (TPR) repeat protein
MRTFLAAAALVIGLTNPAAAQSDATAGPPSAQPWEADQALLKDTEGAVSNGGVSAVGPRVPQLEKALAGAQLTYTIGDTAYILTDGSAEALVAIAMVSENKSGGPKKAVAVDNPYPLIALYLGSYYDETGKFDDAVRVLDLGLSRSAGSGIDLGESRPLLLIERGEALGALKRWIDALADFDDGLKIDGMADKLRAHMYRGRGFVLTELGRLDDAEASYNESLKLEPDNATAEHELKYIAGLKSGGAATKPALAPLNKQAAPAPTPDASPTH